ncbi:MAG: tyrosine-protein phosphatase [Halanaerobium sp.]
MIDLHSHILAGVDDGAQSLEESIAILKTMEAKGVRQVAATSHYPLYNDRDYLKFIQEKIELLREKSKEEKLQIEIISGSEVLISRDTAELLYNNELLTINDTDYILLETRLNNFPSYFESLVHDIKAMGYQIIIAHPERYTYIQKDYDKIYKWVEELELKLMFNSSSLLGKHGKKAKETAEKLLEFGLCHLMASDTHRINKRTFSLDQGLQKAESLKTGSSQFFQNNAQSVINNQPLNSMEIKREEPSLVNKIFSFII